MKVNRVPLQQCPWCAARLDAVSGPDGLMPRPGDLTICLYCGGVSEFTENLELQFPNGHTIEEIANIMRLFSEEGDGKVH